MRAERVATRREDLSRAGREVLRRAIFWPRSSWATLLSRLVGGVCLSAACLSLLFAREDGTVGETDAARREQIASMSSEQKEELRARLEQFSRLSNDERARIRKFHQDLLEDPQRKQLERTLDHYQEWLQSLSSTQRAELLNLPAEQRVAEIKRLLQSQAAQRFAPLAQDVKVPEADFAAMSAWLDEFLIRHETDITQGMPDFLRKQLDHIEDPQRRRVFQYNFYRRRAGRDAIKPSAEDLQSLHDRLSPETRQALAKKSDPRERMELIESWMRAFVFSKMVPQVSRDELERFFNEKLTSHQRDYLESLPPDEMRRELTRMYFKERFDRFDPGRPPLFNRPPGFDRPGGSDRSGGDRRFEPPHFPANREPASGT